MNISHWKNAKGTQRESLARKHTSNAITMLANNQTNTMQREVRLPSDANMMQIYWKSIARGKIVEWKWNWNFP